MGDINYFLKLLALSTERAQMISMELMQQPKKG